MKTKEQIQNEIDRLMLIGHQTSDDSEKNRIRKRLKMLRPLITYFERVNVTEDYVIKQFNDVSNRMISIESEFESLYPSFVTSDVKQQFFKQKGMPDLKRQKKTLEYLLEHTE